MVLHVYKHSVYKPKICWLPKKQRSKIIALHHVVSRIGNFGIIGEKAIRLVNKNYEKADISERTEGDEQAKETYKKIFIKRDKGEW